MASIDLHLAPKRNTIMQEQIRAVGLALRKEGVIFLGIVGLLFVLIVTSLISQPRDAIHIPFGPPSAGLIVIVSLFIPFGVWRSEDPSRRSYHLAMPIAHGPHTLLKMLSGWIWLIVVIAVCVVLKNGSAFALGHIVGGPVDSVSIPLWHWAMPFAAATMIYLLISVVVVGSNHPWRWIGGIIMTYFGAFSFSVMLGWTEIVRNLGDAIIGPYGMLTAIGAHPLAHTTVSYTSQGSSSVQVVDAFAYIQDVLVWLKAVLLWVAIGSIGVCLAAYRRRDV